MTNCSTLHAVTLDKSSWALCDLRELPKHLAIGRDQRQLFCEGKYSQS
jgi:hypothetical protein